jgi:Uma2 family endonuclease
MSTAKPRSLLRIEYEEAAEAYLRSLPPEHFMEAPAQATQRKITVESLDLVQVHRPEVQTFSELLVQYPLEGHDRPRQVVPDNMVVLWKEPLDLNGSYDLPFQPVGPLWVLEYVSKNSKRKDYEDNFKKYEQELKVPYYLLFYPQIQDLTLYHHNGSKYVTVLPNDHGRFAIPELDLEIGLLEGWARYWFKGTLLPLPPDLMRALEEANRLAAEERRLREQAERRAEEAERRAQEQAHLVAEEKRGREEERQARLALAQRLAELHAQLQQRPSPPEPPA